MNPTERAGKEAVKVLDALAVVSTRLSLSFQIAPHMLVLSEGKVRETCDAIDEAVRSLREILLIAAENGEGPVSPSALRKSDESADK